MASYLTVVPGGIMLTDRPYNAIPFRILSIFIELLRIIFIILPLINICNYFTIRISIKHNTPWSFYAGPGFLYPTLKWLHEFKWNDPLLIALLTLLLVFIRKTLADIRQAEMSECILFSRDGFLIATETLQWIRHKRSLSIQDFSMDDVDNVFIRQGYFWSKRKLVIRFKEGRKEIVVFRELQPEVAILADVLEVMRNEINYEMRRPAADNN